MNLGRLRSRLSSNEPQPDAPEDQPADAGRYDGMDETKVNRKLREHSQEELEAIEQHERSHRNRPVILNKLRYLRGREPLPGYDTMTVEQVSGALQGADTDTIRAVREYERKFRRRDAVLSELDEVGRGRRAEIAAGR
jgi:hypothetical protein